MPTNLTQQKPTYDKVVRSAREGDLIVLPVEPVNYLTNEFEKKTKKSLGGKVCNAFSFVSPLVMINLFGFAHQKTLSGLFGTVALSLAATATTSYLAYQGNKFLINRTKAKTDRKIQDYLGELKQDADSYAQRHFAQSINDHVKNGGYIKLHELGKLVNVDAPHLKDTDYRLRLTVSNAKDWVAYNNETNAMGLGLREEEPPKSTSPLKARVHYPTVFRLTTLNLRHSAESKLESAFERVFSGLQDFKHVMFEDPKAKDYLAPYSTTHMVPFIRPTFQIRRIIQCNRTHDMQEALPALNPCEYQ